MRLPAPVMFSTTIVGLPGMCRPMWREITRAYVSKPPPGAKPTTRRMVLPSKKDWARAAPPPAASTIARVERARTRLLMSSSVVISGIYHAARGARGLGADAGERELLGPMASHEVIGDDLPERRRLGPAHLGGERTAGMEVAARRRIGGGGGPARPRGGGPPRVRG